MAELRTPHFVPASRSILSQHSGVYSDVDWSLATDDVVEEAPMQRGYIELHGAAYVAFCKPWGPLFVAPEESEDAV